MKCIHCGTNADYKTRQATGRCPGCMHYYSFEPKEMDFKLTDPFFQAAIDKVSYEGRLYFTSRQLWYELNRGLWRKRMVKPGSIITTTVIAAVIAFMFFNDFPLLVVALAITALLVMLAWNYYIKHSPRHTPIMNLGFFTPSVLASWTGVHGRPQMLMHKDGLTFGINPRGEESDLTDYSFDRLVITENKDTATMLVANKLQLEKKCAILYANDLSSDRASQLLKMVKHNPLLKVIVIHDASVEGCGLLTKLRQESWFPEDSVEWVDLGLRPNQARKLRLFTIRKPDTHVFTEHPGIKHLAPEEIDWLKQGNTAELEGLRPRRLLRSISYGFALAEKADLADDSDQDDWAFDLGEGFLWIESFG